MQVNSVENVIILVKIVQSTALIVLLVISIWEELSHQLIHVIALAVTTKIRIHFQQNVEGVNTAV